VRRASGERIILVAGTHRDEIARAIDGRSAGQRATLLTTPRRLIALEGDMIMGHMSDTKVGDRVEIIRCYDAYTKLKRGTQGTVTLIDQLGTVHVRWDDGRISDSSRARMNGA
jgi:hypothetical protein